MPVVTAVGNERPDEESKDEECLDDESQVFRAADDSDDSAYGDDFVPQLSVGSLEIEDVSSEEVEANIDEDEQNDETEAIAEATKDSQELKTGLQVHTDPESAAFMRF